MAKKCLPGVICIENVTLVSIFIILIVVLSVWYFMNQKEINKSIIQAVESKTGAKIRS